MRTPAHIAVAAAIMLLHGLASAQQPSAWTVNPASVVPDKDFDFKLLNAKYSGCGTVFEHPSATLDGGTIELSFKPVQKLPACSSSSALTGPAFHMNALKAGSYPVKVWEQPACYPDCHVIPQFVGPVDTLAVSSTTALHPAQGTPQARAGRHPARLRTGPGNRGAGTAREVLANGQAVPRQEVP